MLYDIGPKAVGTTCVRGAYCSFRHELKEDFLQPLVGYSLVF